MVVNSKTVWLLWEYDSVLGVFSTKELAEAARVKMANRLAEWYNEGDNPDYYYERMNIYGRELDKLMGDLWYD